jgi:hypothetical protein
MIRVYKLGEGPFNYDWNIRYIKIQGSELFYSPNDGDKDMKEIDIKGAAVSSVCCIKDKAFAICITLPPPVNKSIFLATDSLSESQSLREKIIYATFNDDQTENYHDDVEEHATNINLNNLKNNSEDVISVGLSKINKFNKFYSEKFLERLEFIKNEISSINKKYKGKYIEGIKIYRPGQYDYRNTYKIIISNKISTRTRNRFSTHYIPI